MARRLGDQKIDAPIGEMDLLRPETRSDSKSEQSLALFLFGRLQVRRRRDLLEIY
jgi:hypothetical protein